jgi:hypothetical protein
MMHAMQVSPEQRASVTAALRRAGANFAFVHGSRASGSARADSDLDVAAWWSGAAPAAWDIDVPAGVDLLVLNGAPLELAGRVALHGVLLFEDDPSARVRWQADTRRIFLDEEERQRRLDALYLRRRHG